MKGFEPLIRWYHKPLHYLSATYTAPDKGLEPPSLFKATSVFKTDLLPIRVIRQNADTPPLEPLQGTHPSVLLEIILSDCSVAASFYIYNGAETIIISVSPTFHLSQLLSRILSPQCAIWTTFIKVRSYLTRTSFIKPPSL